MAAARALLPFGALVLGCASAAPPMRIAGPTFGPPTLVPERDDAPAPVVIPPAIAAMLGETRRCPVEMALVDGRVCVDRWEASLVERLPGGAERPWSPYRTIDGAESRVRAVSRRGAIPQGYVSGRQAALACAASGKRLCSASEWETACRGPALTQFPYGDARRAHVCNDDGRATHPVPEVGRRLGIPREALWRDGMNEPLINQLPGTLEPTGARAGCTNDWGVFDMVGNLHEWIDDPDGTFRGGYYMDTSKNGEGCSYATTAHDFTYHDYSTGFRCCMDPEGVE
ncbi:MAG TPA: SUMF1/EgtB/PvdO family nonheme iron enzyme [Minicystis sp.]|nr:SUMF1/EgtB/PvdO family nonheme iron enzyme [Minicystis sp.]